MKSKIFSLVLLTHFLAFGQGQIFTAGEVYTFEFTPLSYQQSPVGSSRFNSSFSVSYGTNTLDANESLLVELFPNSLADIPLLSQIETGPTDGSSQGYSGITFVWFSTDLPYWPDLQGIARVTMLSGTVELYSLTSGLKVDPNYHLQTVMIPEPTATSLSIVALGICFGLRIGKQRSLNLCR